MTFKEIEKLIKKDGWYLQSTIGSHYHYVHDSKKGKVTIPFHGNQQPRRKRRGCCSHKVVAVGFNTLRYDAERRGINPSARIKNYQNML